MRRADLSNVVMHVKALNFPGMDVEEIFSSLIEPPSMGRVHAALETLQNVGALTKDEELTPLGRVLLQIPIDVTFARMVLYGCLFKCLDSAVTLAALLSNREPFVNPPGAKQQALEAKNSWSSPEQKSDAIAALRAYNAWRQLQGGGKTYEANNFCSNNFLSRPVLTQVQKLRNALLHALQTSGVIDVAMAGQQQNPSVSPSVRRDRLDFDIPTALNENADNLNVIGGLIAIGFQPKFATRTSDLTFRTYSDKARFLVSCLCLQHPTLIVVYSSRSSIPAALLL
jgi:HrpA-like RNA helicase